MPAGVRWRNQAAADMGAKKRQAKRERGAAVSRKRWP